MQFTIARSASTGPNATLVDQIPSGAAALPAPRGAFVAAPSNSSASLWSAFLLLIVQMYNLLTLNINGLNDHIKQTALIDWLKCMKADIMCLQETHASSHSSIQGWFRNSVFYVAFSSVSNKRCGTAILVRDIFSITQVKRDDDGRFLQVEVDISVQKLCFISLYAQIGTLHAMPFLLLFLILWT